MEHLTTQQVLNSINKAMLKKLPFSLVRIGDGENIMLAQNSVWSLNRIYKEVWTKQAMKGTKGVSIPNIPLRDQMVEAIKHADIVGILPENDQKIAAPEYLKRPLTNSIFKHYNIKPEITCDAKIMRECANKEEFWKLFKGKRVLILYQYARELTTILRRKHGVNVNFAIPFKDHKQISSTLQTIEKYQHKFDVALLSCGVNSVVLAYEIAKRTGKVAIDFGKPAKYMVFGSFKSR